MGSVVLPLLILLLAGATPTPAAAVGVNWGTMMSHHMLPSDVVQMLKANGIRKVKLFDADSWTVSALAGTGIEVMLAIPNDQLQRMNSYGHAKDWVKENVTTHLYEGGVKIKYVAVGNEAFLKSYNGSFDNTTLPAMKNIQKALEEAGFGNRIKVTTPLNADVYESPGSKPVPSAGNFRSDIKHHIHGILAFLHENKAPFTVNIYPFLSLYQGNGFPVEFAFFEGRAEPVVDGKMTYDNVFDANFDTLVWSLKKAGYPNMKIVVGEVGWPTDGDINATPALAKRFYEGFLKKMAMNKGTPLRPGRPGYYLFGLIDEDMKSILPGNFERHWGIFTYDGRPKFAMDLSGKGRDRMLVGVKNVEYLPAQWCVFNDGVEEKEMVGVAESMKYACSLGDCTALGYGSSCNHLDERGNISYAFNMYFQMQDQDVRACEFDGLAKLTTTNQSKDGCLFPVQILNGATRPVHAATLIVVFVVALQLLLLLPSF